MSYPKVQTRRWCDFRGNARQRGLVVTMTKDEFLSQWQKPCTYCGDPMSSVGYDRLDNDRGYDIDNVVPCCSTCNYMKRQMTKDEFMDKCLKVLRYNNLLRVTLV
jgi:hypothetical protein